MSFHSRVTAGRGLQQLTSLNDAIHSRTMTERDLQQPKFDVMMPNHMWVTIAHQ